MNGHTDRPPQIIKKASPLTIFANAKLRYYSGIERDNEMADKLIYIPYDNDDTEHYPSVDYNYWLKGLGTQISEPTNQNSIKSPQS